MSRVTILGGAATAAEAAIAGTPIGTPGGFGFGVGVCPAATLPDGFTPMPGYADPLHPNYGNYLFRDGSVMVWIPAFYYRINHASNPTYSRNTPNDIHIVGSETFSTRAAAAVGGYALHRAFIDGGVEQPGFFVDKYMCSKNALGTGYIASSLRNGKPLSCASDHNPVGGLTAVSGLNVAYAFVRAAHARDGENGDVNADSRFFCLSRQVWSALMMLQLAHGQAASSQAAAAWYDPAATTNFPKGCNNNALRDANDSQVVYQSDGYSNCGLTGSASPFERTTHNGQPCGVADLGGLMWDVTIGMTCVATAKSITGATQASPCALTVPGHGLTTGAIVQVHNVSGMTQLNDMMFTVTVVDADTVTLDGVNATAYTAYTSDGTLSVGEFFATRESMRMAEYTSGTTLETDHWGAVGIAATMDPLPLPVLAASGGSPCPQRFGNGSNQVLSGELSGSEYALTGLGVPRATSGMSTGGAALFGTDYLYQRYIDSLCALSGGSWSSGSLAGACALYLNFSRWYSYNNAGFRCACYAD